MLKLHRIHLSKVGCVRNLSKKCNELGPRPLKEGPFYPALQDVSLKARQQKDSVDWHDDIGQVPTVEEKLLKMNMPRYYGYKVVNFSDSKTPYNDMPVTQHYTRTVMEKLESSKTGPIEKEKAERIFNTARKETIEALEFSYDYCRHLVRMTSKSVDYVAREKHITQIIVEQLNRALLKVMSPEYPHLSEVEIDYNPRHEAFWAVGGVQSTKNVVNSRNGCKWQIKEANNSSDRIIQYSGNPYMCLRHHKQLASWKTPFESNDVGLSQNLPLFKYDVRCLGYNTEHRHVTNIPGHWPCGNEQTFAFLSVHSRAHLQLRPKCYAKNDLQEALDALAIKASYCLLLAHASYHGFNTYNDVTYPLNTQTIITNGQEWSFYEYQLNTLLIHGDNAVGNPKVNFCRGSPPLPLFAEVSPTGKCVGFNDETLKQLLNFYGNVPKIQRTPKELQPFISSRLSEYTNSDQCDFIDKKFKHLTSNRQRHLEIPEIFLWEKLYKIDNKTRPMEAKRRFFERNINPWRRRLDEYDEEYVPKALRLRNERKNKAFKEKFYP
ncbi:uncharacterized protein Dana_GF19982 [Drosophila ananassae]|uniref:28S ribosomal protein S30, mitochondrial n=1 Tax=Drosophila ananassae TaxID=7217 RepID=B3MPV0_DROAN|nr:39S ribosomal protein S30, mitochondrial isoform X1 [Drosophila ananassae]EDV44712.1 uncharacterized protein Dana_GF19982 [Drosophila ananassae]